MSEYISDTRVMCREKAEFIDRFLFVSWLLLIFEVISFVDVFYHGVF